VRSEALFWILTGLVGLLLVFVFLVLTVRRFGRRVSTLVEPPLFKRLADAHGLSPAQRLLLLRLASRQGLPNPALYFVSPSLLARGLAILRNEDLRTARGAGGMAEILFRA
jgi:hypothetical protein